MVENHVWLSYRFFSSSELLLRCLLRIIVDDVPLSSSSSLDDDSLLLDELLELSDEESDCTPISIFGSILSAMEIRSGRTFFNSI